MKARFKITSDPLSVKKEMWLIGEEGEPSTFLGYNLNISLRLCLLFSERDKDIPSPARKPWVYPSRTVTLLPSPLFFSL